MGVLGVNHYRGKKKKKNKTRIKIGIMKKRNMLCVIKCVIKPNILLRGLYEAI